MNYLAGNLLIRIKNASQARHTQLEVPYSHLTEALVTLLIKKGFLVKAKVVGEVKKNLEIELKYEGRKPAFKGVRLISRPGLRLYYPLKDLAHFRRRENGMVILSTSQGLMTLAEARKAKVGGELLFEVW